MDIEKDLDPRFRIDSSEQAATQREIDALIAVSQCPVPDDYLSIIKKMTEVEILVRDKRYIRIWGPSGCIEMNSEYEIQRHIPGSLAIGDDEGGMAIIIMVGVNGYGLYKVGFGDMSVEGATFIAASISDLLVRGVGIEKL